MTKKFKLKKKPMRNLTKNEKILLSLLAIIILSWAIYKFVIDPQKTKLRDLSEKKMEYDEQVTQMNAILKSEISIDEEWTKLNREKDSIIGKYFLSLEQPQIIYLLNELLDSEEIHILDMNFNMPYEEQIGDLQVKSMDVNIPYRGNFQGVMDTINSIDSSPKKMLMSNLIIDQDSNNELVGNIELKIYSLEEMADIAEDIAYIDTGKIGNKSNPFIAFEGFKTDKESEGKEDEGTTGYVDGGYSYTNGDYQSKEDEENYYTEVLETFDKGNLYFIPSHNKINGRLSKSSNSKNKKNSLRLEYNILAIEDENRANIDLTDKNIIIKYPPTNLGLWVHSYSYSPATLGLRFSGQAGEKVDVELSKGVNWIGWQYLEVNPPEDLSIYPLQLDRIYLELAYNRDDYGVLLFDKLEANYPKDTNKVKESFTFYIVEKDDTINKVCLKNYGNLSKKSLVMKHNEIKSDEDLKTGRILVIPR